MKQQWFLRSVLSLLVLALASPAWVSAEPTTPLPQFGVELEFARENSVEVDVKKIPLSAYTEMAGAIQQVYGGQGNVRTQLFERYRNKGAQQAVYTDPQGREWNVVPESVNTSGLDGLEMVSPPLRSEADERDLVEVFRRLQATGEYGPGVRSSMHVTVDASHLFDRNGDASKLVDTILFIENHWREIYSAVSPMRYGTVVNRFSVPLAAEQSELLQELAAMPKEARTYANVQALFQKYEARELALKDGSSNKAWKYRAANYKKLFGLQGADFVPVIEFRITDFTSPEEILPQIQFLRRVIAEGANLEPNGNTFRDPFRGTPKDVGEHFDHLTQRIADLPEPEYAEFLKRLGFSSIDYPRLGRLRGPPSYGVSAQETQRLVGALDPSQPVLSHEGNPITFGFEAEFKGLREGRILKSRGFLGMAMSIRDEFRGFLEEAHREMTTGNAEVNSKPTDKMAEIFPQMRQVRSELGGSLRGFHLHMRIPKEMVAGIPENEFRAWVSRMSDYVAAWRLENRRTFWALGTWSNSRNAPNSLRERGTIRMETQGNTWDIELRGFMGEVEEIQKLAEIIVAGAKNPELIRGFAETQEALFKPRMSLEDAVEAHLQRYHQRGLTENERKVLADITANAVNSRVGSRNHLPLVGFEEAGFLTPLQARRFHNARFNFMKGMVTILRNWESGKYGNNHKELYKQYRWRIKQWALEADLKSTLEATLLIDPKLDLSADPSTPEGLRQLLLRGSREDRAKATAYLETLKPEERAKLLDFLLRDSRVKLRENAVEVFTRMDTLGLEKSLVRALGDDALSVREWVHAWLRGNRRPEVEAELHAALESGAKPQLRANALMALTPYGFNERTQGHMERAMDDASFLVRQTVQKIAPQFGESATTTAWLKRGLQDGDAGVKLEALKGLLGFKSAEAASAAGQSLRSSDPAFRERALQLVMAQNHDTLSPTLAQGILSEPLPDLGLWERMRGAYHNPLDALLLQVHRKAAAALAAFEGEIPPEAVRAALQSRDPQVRALGASALSHVSGPEAAALFQLALQDRESNVRTAALSALAGRTEESQFPSGGIFALIEGHLFGRDRAMQEAALKALDGRSDPRSAALLKRFLEGRPTAALAQLAAKVLGQRKDPHAFEGQVLAAFHRDAEVSAHGLAGLAQHPETATRMDRATAERLLPLVAEGTARGTSAAAALVQSLGGDFQVVKDAIARNANPLVRERLVGALTSAPSSQFSNAYQLAQQAMGDADPTVLAAAYKQLSALAPYGPGNVIEGLLTGLESLNPAAREFAAKALAKLQLSGVPEGLRDRFLAAVEKAFERGIEGEVSPLVETLQEFRGDATPKEKLIQWLNSSNPKVRLAAVSVLTGRGDPASVELLQSALGHSDPEIRRVAARAVAERFDAPGRQLHETTLTHPDLQVRLAAIEGLGSRTDERAFDLLKERMRQGVDQAERTRAAQLLLQHPDVLSRLQSLKPGEIARLLQLPASDHTPAFKTALRALHPTLLTQVGTRVVGNPSPPPIRAVFDALEGREPGKGTLAFYQAALSHPDVEVADKALRELSGRSPTELLKGLKGMLASPNSDIRVRGVNFLNRSQSLTLDEGQRDLYRELQVAALTSPDQAVRDRAMTHLQGALANTVVEGGVGFDAISLILRSMVNQTGSPAGALAAARLLKGNQRPETLPLLREFYAHADPQVKAAAEEAIRARTDDGGIALREELGIRPPPSVRSVLSSVGNACLNPFRALRRRGQDSGSSQ